MRKQQYYALTFLFLMILSVLIAVLLSVHP